MRFSTLLLLLSLGPTLLFALLGAQMLHMAEFGAHLAKQMDGGRNGAVVSFSMALIRHCLLDERTVIASDCKELLTALAQLAQAGQGPEGLVPILEQVHATALAAHSPLRPRHQAPRLRSASST